MPCLDNKSFYKGNIIPSFMCMGHLFLSQIPNKNSALIVQASRISELILTYELDIAIPLRANAKHPAPDRSSSWANVYKHFKKPMYTAEFHKTLEDINRIYNQFRNSAQHYITASHPVNDEIETAILNIYKLMNLSNPNFCKTLIKELIQDNKKFYATYILLYSKVEDIHLIADTFKKNIVDKTSNVLKSRGKQYVKDTLNSSLLDSFDILLQYDHTELIEVSKNILNDPDNRTVSEEQRKYLLLTE